MTAAAAVAGPVAAGAHEADEGCAWRGCFPGDVRCCCWCGSAVDDAACGATCDGRGCDAWGIGAGAAAVCPALWPRAGAAARDAASVSDAVVAPCCAATMGMVAAGVGVAVAVRTPVPPASQSDAVMR